MTPRIPAGLGRRGGAFWRRVMGEYEPAVDDAELLLEVCRLLDLCEALQGRLDEAGVLVELRLQRTLLARLMVQLALPDAEGERMPSPVSVRAKKAAGARWAGHVKRGDD